MTTIEIAGRKIGEGYPVYIIAEISANHNQRFDDALRIVRAAKHAGADAVKLQTYTPDTITIACSREEFLHQSSSLWAGKTLHDLYQEAYTPWEWQPKLKEEAERLGLHCFSSPFDLSAVDFLEQMNVPAYKIASFELVDIPLIQRVGRTGKPVIMSTGMAVLAEIDEAVRVARGAGANGVGLLKCTSAYPAPASDANLRTIPHLAATFEVVAGLSDHTPGAAVPITAVSLGCSIIEKHLTLARSNGGPDAAFSLEPDEFKGMVEGVRAAEQALGRVCFSPTKSEMASRQFRRSLYCVCDVSAGELFTSDNVRSIRPGAGLAPKYISDVIGRRAARQAPKGTPLSWDLLAG